MLKAIAMIGACVLFAVGGSASAAMTAKEKDKERTEIRKESGKILSALYKAQPSAKKAVDSAAGYATFSNFGVKIFLAGSGSGKGVAIMKGDQKEVFMKMLEVQAGLGIGVKSFRLVFVFESQGAFNNFVNSGWDSSAQATAAATTGSKGGSYAGAMQLTSGTWLYQLTDQGLAAELTVKGTKYYKNDDLN